MFKMKRTGTLLPGQQSVISFLGRNIYQKKDGALYFGLKPGCFRLCGRIPDQQGSQTSKVGAFVDECGIHTNNT